MTNAPDTVSYIEGSSNEQQKLDLFLPSSTASQLVVFVHGGAWRSGSRKEHQDLARFLCDRDLAVALVDYRLSTRNGTTDTPVLLHPAHCEDVLAALDYLGHRAEAKREFPSSGWTLVGHSVGAWLALSALSTGSRCQVSSQYPARMPQAPQSVRHAIRDCVLVDGIYSIPKLLEEYPDYESFVAQAFVPKGCRTDYTSVSLDSWQVDTVGKTFHVWHSRDDQLLSFKQSAEAVLNLNKSVASGKTSAVIDVPIDGVAAWTKVRGENILVKDVYPHLESTNPTQVRADFDSLRLGHDELLQTKMFWDRICQVAQPH